MARAAKVRLDELLVERGFFPSREQARRALLAGKVEVDGRRDVKPGQLVSREVHIDAREAAEPFVSRAGRKLAGALDCFRIDVSGLRCLDVGASTGGFTDCLLQRGASEVTALDVGYGLLASKLRNDPRVTAVERTNARYLTAEHFTRPFDLITVDVSFISVLKVIPALLPHLRSGGSLLILVKPQFEAGREAVRKGGIVRDESARLSVIARTVRAIELLGVELLGVVDSSVPGMSGNVEAVAWFQRRAA